ncbi:hypothetical protein [Streptomyces californicus]|uniref:hypothetical protein n=1 Tax=Streptomyces californicus TaxID=67351 RepID=UPI0036CBB165
MRETGGIQARGSWLEAEHLLSGGPADGVLVFSAWAHVRDLARVLHRLVDEHRSQLADGKTALTCGEPPDGPATAR